MAEVRLEEITKFYGSLKIIDKLNLGIGSGEFVTLLGPSGSGKTTTLKIVAGLELPTSGKLSIGGQDMTRVPVNMRKIGMVFQNLALFPHMTVAENVAFGLRMRRLPRARIEEDVARALDMVQLSRFSGRTPDQISGGQQQRVALARALAPGPSIMLLDEPFSALDEHLRAQIRDDIIDILRRSNSAAIIVTHDRHEALSCADRVGLLDNGHLLQLDTPENIYQRPASPLVARFISDNSLLLPAELDAGACCAQSALAQRVPIEIMSAQGLGQHARTGKLLIRADQLEPTRVGGDGAICSASVQRIKFHGSHSQVDLLAGDTRISLDLTGGVHAQLRIGDTIGLRLVGNGLFYPH